MSLEIRDCRADEIDEVLEVWREAGSPPSATDSTEHVRSVLEHDGAWLLVAADGGRIAGTLIAAWDGWRGNFYRLAVRPGYRRRGIAQKLVAAGEERLRGAGARRLSAIVMHASDEARGFWAAAGFEHQLETGRFVKTRSS